MPATFTSCKDYDDDIAVLTQQTGSLQSQVNSLEEALNANKEAAAQAAQAAADAMSAAKAAQATADEALAAAKAAQATGDEALALAKSNEAAVAAAQADALYAQALAEEAKQAAATAKAEAIAEVMEQVKALMEEQRTLTEKELAKIAGQIEGIEKGLNELSGALEGVNGDLDRVENELTDKINVVADELATLEQAVEVQRAAFEEFQTLVNGKIETLESNYATLQETVEGIEDTIAEITQDVSDLQAADQAMQNGIDLMKADIVKITLDVENLQISVKANADAIATINERLDVIDGLLAALDKKIDDVKDQAFGYTDAEVAELRTDLMGVITTIEATLNGKIDLINKNITSIQGDITNIQGDITNMQDEITVVKGDIKDINGKITNIQGDITVIRGDITGIQGDIANINEDITTIKGDVNSIKDQLSQMNDEITAIHGDIDRLSGYIEDINGKIGEINKQLEAINGRLDGIDGRLDGIDGQINNINGTLGEHSILISNLGDKLNNTINTLVTVFANRLTSVTLMPDAYADGIPCIDFTTATFQEMTQGATADDWYVANDAKTMYITPDALPVSYRLSPKSVSPFSIEDVSFVEKTASILTRGAEDDCIIKVEGYTVENGVLVVRAAKNRKAAINKTQDGKINIAALRVKQKSTMLDNETLKGAEVHSEYARVTEGYYTPTLAAIAKPENHLWSKTDVEGTEFASVVYDAEEKLDLKNLISVCRVLNDKHSIIEDLSSYNLTIDFALAEMNTAVYSVIENGVITPGAMVDGKFVAAHPTAAYQKQIYRATLKHDDKVVDVKFVEVYFRPSEKVELTVDFPGVDTKISCNPKEDYTITVKWTDFAEKVFYNENIAVANADEFNALYNRPQIYFSGFEPNKPLGDFISCFKFDSTLDPANPYAWQITFDNIPADIFPLVVGGKKTLDVTMVADPKNPANYPKVVAKTFLTIEFPNDYLSKMEARNQAYWKDATTLRVLPIQKGTPNPATGNVLDKCEYYFPVFQAFMEQPVVKNSALVCAKWDFRFSSEQEDEYFATKAQDGINNVNSYVLANTLGDAAFIKWPNDGNGEHFVWDETSAKGHNAYITLRHGDAAKALLNQGVNANVEFVAKYPNGQVLPVQSYVLEFVKPLIIKPFIIEESFKDGVLEGETGSIINTNREFVMYDFRNQPVSKESTNGLYDYYDVKEITWDVANARVGIKKTGEVLSNPEDLLSNGKIDDKVTTALTDAANAHMSLTHNGSELIYLNTGGVPAEKDFYIAINVSVVHKWGEFTTPVVVKVEAGEIRYNKVRK